MASVDLVTTGYGTSTAALRIGAGSSVAGSAAGAVVLGPGATSNGWRTVTIGAGARAGSQDSGSSATGSVVIGAAAKAEHDNSVVIGSSAYSTGTNSSGGPAAVAVGRSAKAAPRGAAVGSSAVAGVAGTAVGSGSTVEEAGVALGGSATASSGSVAVGTAAKASGIYSSGSTSLPTINPEGRHLVIGESARGIVAEFPIASDDDEGSDAQVVVTGFSQVGETNANHFHISTTDYITIKGMRFANPVVVSGKIGKLAEGGNTFVYAFPLGAITVVNNNTITCIAGVAADPEQSVATIIADAKAGKLVLQLFTQTTKSNVVAANWHLHSPRNPAPIKAPKPDSLVLGSSSYTKLGDALVVGHDSVADMGGLVFGHGSSAGRRSIVIGNAVHAAWNSDIICFSFSPTQQIAVTSSSFIQMLKTNCSEVTLDGFDPGDTSFYIDAITGVTEGREEGTFTAGENVCIIGRGLTLLDGDYVEASATWTGGAAQGLCTVVESSNTQIIVTLPVEFIAVPWGTEVSFFVHGRAGDTEADQQIVGGTSTRAAYTGDPLIAYFDGKARNTFGVDANDIVTVKGAGFTDPNVLNVKLGKLAEGGNTFTYSFTPTNIRVVDNNTLTFKVSAAEEPDQTDEQLAADSAAGLIVLRLYTQTRPSNDFVARYVTE